MCSSSRFQSCLASRVLSFSSFRWRELVVNFYRLNPLLLYTFSNCARRRRDFHKIPKRKGAVQWCLKREDTTNPRLESILRCLCLCAPFSAASGRRHQGREYSRLPMQYFSLVSSLMKAASDAGDATIHDLLCIESKKCTRLCWVPTIVISRPCNLKPCNKDFETCF